MPEKLNYVKGLGYRPRNRASDHARVSLLNPEQSKVQFHRTQARLSDEFHDPTVTETPLSVSRIISSPNILHQKFDLYSTSASRPPPPISPDDSAFFGNWATNKSS